MTRLFSTIVAALGLALVATPALAQDFSGPRVGVELGVVGDDFASTDETTYGANAGYDFDLGNTVVGGTVAYNRQFNDNGANVREIAVSARAGIKASPATLVYATGGYSNIDTDFGDVDGYKVGLGLEHSFGRSYVSLETRYGNYQHGGELYQTSVGVGFRF